MVKAMLWLALAPTCRVTADAAVATEPARIFRPLNSVSLPVMSDLGADLLDLDARSRS